RGEAAKVLTPGTHGSTFSGNPLVCRAALAVLETLMKEKLDKRAAALGQRLLAGFQQALGNVPGVKQIRGRGLMLAIELDRPCKEVLTLALGAGLLINVTADNVVRLLPPLILTDAEADEIVARLAPVVRAFLAQSPVTAVSLPAVSVQP
ncbi:MAG: aminotransferase class III-fold pyridoxal phosphate-dependent enzyme, partial [Gammaproteobacteria bacterium]|nr:aminotransferase class III-fold pyridoxal phosphate-dependent enzyme [Gammaproteobacteria bacterium]